MITALLISIAVLLIALWISTMALWHQHEQRVVPKIIKPDDVVYQWNKGARLARRSWYGGMRYGKQAVIWGNKKVRTAFITVFPKSKTAFVERDILTGLEHGPSSYFLASLSKTIIQAAPKIKRVRSKKVSDITQAQDNLSEQ